MKYYPALVDLKDKQAVVVGGGKVAERKARLLLRAGASVKVISPEITGGLKRLAETGRLEHFPRMYRKGDLGKAFVVVAGTSSPDVNRRVASHARCLVNVVDLPDEGNFIVPSIVKRGMLTLAISTEGASPALSKTVRRELEVFYGKDVAAYLRFVESVRKKAVECIADGKARKRFLTSLASENTLAMLRQEGLAKVKKMVHASLKKMT